MMDVVEEGSVKGRGFARIALLALGTLETLIPLWSRLSLYAGGSGRSPFALNTRGARITLRTRRTGFSR